MRMSNEAWAKANADAGRIGQLTAENEYLKRELSDARAQITEIRQGVQQIGRKVDATQSSLATVERRVGNTVPAPLESK
jgi:predicted  nucleic acid-binding Zn-ribbon protein